MIKKKIFLAMALVVLGNNLCAQQGPHVAEDNSGKERLLGIITNSETGLPSCRTEENHYAELKNVAHDLHSDEIIEFFGCKTIAGKAFFAEALNSPLSPKDQSSLLSRRQAIIKALVENPEFKAQIESRLELARQEEQEILTLLSDFFKGKTCPELKQLELLKQQQQMGVYHITRFLTMNPAGRVVNSAVSLLSMVALPFGTAICARSAYRLRGLGIPNPTLEFFTAYYALISGIVYYTFYKDYSNAADKREKLHALRELVVIAEGIQGLADKNGLQPECSMHKALKSNKGVAVVEGLKHSRYKYKKSKFFAIPFVHSFLYKVYEEEKKLAPVFVSIGEWDTYNAIATKILESQRNANKLCFATYNSSEKSCIRAQGFWNVLIPGAVVNDLDESLHIILTGPNAGGKTSSIRAILQNIVLAQSFGVAAAESFELTPFDVIHSYLNISDDLKNGMSLFASELNRAKGILQRIKDLQPGQKFFFALDELFTGTVAEDGEICAYKFVEQIAHMPGTQFIYATHFGQLKILGDNDACCKNYKVDAPIKDDLGKLVYPYTLNKGANESNVALDMAQEAGLFS